MLQIGEDHEEARAVGADKTTRRLKRGNGFNSV